MIRLHTLGSLVVEVDGRPTVGAAAQPRRSAVLLLLLRAGARGVTREKILSLLWPDVPEDRARRTLAQALYTLRRDLGGGAAILGSGTLRINPDVVTADVAEFQAAIAAGDHDRAVALYRGPFVDGFSLPDAPEFERWVEEERRVLAAACLGALKRLAREAGSGPDRGGQVAAWRRVVAFDPIDTEATVGLIRAMRDAGDIAGALRYAQEYSRRLASELDLPPSPEVRALIEELCAPKTVPPIPRVTTERPAVPAGRAFAEVEPVAPATPTAERRPPMRAPWGAIVIGAGLLIAAGSFSRIAVERRPAPLVVIGRVADFTGAGQGVGGAVRELLATDLARSSGLAVLSSERVYDLLRSRGRLEDTSLTGYLDAARSVSAAHLFDGTIWPAAGGGYRLDLRRVDPASGVITADRSVTGTDLHAMADTLALWVASGLGVEAGRFEPVTTSLEAFRWYREGLQAYVRDERTVALSHFDRALQLDSMLVMAEYYRALSYINPVRMVQSLNRAHRLSTRLAERDRLLVNATWALRNRPGAALATADSLATLYPAEVAGHYLRGQVLLQRGQARAALSPLRRALRMAGAGDPAGVEGRVGDISTALVNALITLDSVGAAHAVAREWIARLPRSYRGTAAYAWTLRLSGQAQEAFRAYEDAELLAPRQERIWGGGINGFLLDAFNAEGEYERTMAYLEAYDPAEHVEPEDVEAERGALRLWRSVSLRDQGRYAEALANLLPLPDTVNYGLISEAMLSGRLALLRGDQARARRVFETVARTVPEWHGEVSSRANRRAKALHLMYVAEPVALAGDVEGLRRIRDTLQALLETGAAPQEQAPLRHVRGLVAHLEGRLADAESEFRAAMVAPVLGYTWTNLWLARTLMERGRPRQAIEPLRAALRHQVLAVALAEGFLPRPIIQAHLARAWELAEMPDSAAAARQRFRRLWRNADPDARPIPDPATPVRARDPAP